MKKMMQFRFHSRNNANNYPSILTMDDWKFNLLSKYGTVSHLGIQGEPGVVFYLNGGNNPITLGDTGIYELNLEGIGRISKLRFNEEKLIEYYPDDNTNLQHRLLVDIVYEGAEK